MRISSFNINKFCGPYSNKGKYYNPKNIDFKTSIKKIVNSLLENEDDIVFLQEFVNSNYINVGKLFPEDKYFIHSNVSYVNSKVKSIVVAITLKGSLWKMIDLPNKTDFANKFIEMNFKDNLIKKSLCIISFHNTYSKNKIIKKRINDYFDTENMDVILGDFNDTDWIVELHENENLGYRDLVTNDMITYKPGQSAIDRIFVKKEKFNDKIVFNGVVETFLSDHNLLTFSLNL